MKIFLSWSGSRSKIVATEIKNLIDTCIHGTEPWMSDEDITPVERWNEKISNELRDSKFGVICLTPENIDSRWILFEAGALAKTFATARVVPILYGLDVTDLEPPLSQFQAIKKIEKQAILSLITSINSFKDDPDSIERVEKIFDLSWADFESKITDIPMDTASAKGERRKTEEILEDVFLQNKKIEFAVEKAIEILESKQTQKRPVVLSDRHRSWVVPDSTIVERMADRIDDPHSRLLFLLDQLPMHRFLAACRNAISHARSSKSPTAVGEFSEAIVDYVESPRYHPAATEDEENIMRLILNAANSLIVPF